MKLKNTILNNSMFRHVLAIAVLSIALASCSTSTSVNVSEPLKVIGKTFTGDTLRGALNGTILSRTAPYYMDANVIINAGDTLLFQQGVTVIVINNNANGSPEFQVYGTFISLGSSTQPNYFTVLPSMRTYANLVTGLWGGIQCASPTVAPPNGSGDLILHWTHIEFAGGSSGATDPVVGAKKVRYGIWFQNPNSNFIMEDSWISGATDDPIRVSGGKISIFRNVFESGSNTSGDGCNIKSGTQGDIAYNLFIGNCTNGPKLSNKGGLSQTNVNVYNNTIVTCGWRQTQTARAGSSNIEEGARGVVYNNLIVNCRTGFRLLDNPLADTANTAYDYQWYYGATDSIVALFKPADGLQQFPRPHDVHGTTKQNDPLFASYDVNQVDPSKYTWPIAITNQDPVENVVTTSDSRGAKYSDLTKSFKSDFHLKANSPCIGKAFTGSVKLNSGAAVTVPMNVCPQKSSANPYGATTKGLGADFGAYQADGTGNQQ